MPISNESTELIRQRIEQLRTQKTELQAKLDLKTIEKQELRDKLDVVNAQIQALRNDIGA